ncbi:uncharacterized protein F5147DRAFT_651041 [Suillus discolor]|uniref:Uncharacterized protein n=1 Tax=Suillus discolor TaxID=1912936 RepID=A0A9P7JVP0_9AGAM|nr:uncharacterized protein F5147DRAFT_651041 [Suillus discolor]KAG2111911.1 hypothetical protein F5147DRAFT_651041 [Suillus discolor]
MTQIAAAVEAQLCAQKQQQQDPRPAEGLTAPMAEWKMELSTRRIGHRARMAMQLPLPGRDSQTAYQIEGGWGNRPFDIAHSRLSDCVPESKVDGADHLVSSACSASFHYLAGTLN